MNPNFPYTDPFSAVAREYDAAFTRLPSARIIRERVRSLFLSALPEKGTVLDIAGGTGEDAAWLEEKGFGVIGADQSFGMLAEARAKTCSMPDPPGLVQLDASSLAMFRDSSFDAVLSNFGGLNCVPDLHAALVECHRVLRPKGTMVLCLLGAHSIWETLAFLLRGSLHNAFRRQCSGPVAVSVGGQTVSTWYYSLRSLRDMIDGLFTIEKIAALNVVAPPPGSQSFPMRYPRLSSLLLDLDQKVQSVPFVRALGDHTVLLLRRRELA